MQKRFVAAMVGLCIMSGVTAAEARSYHGHVSKSSGVSRSCLTGAASNLLARIEANFGPVRVVSTCRPGARIAGTRKISRHASGNAVDFDAGKRKGAILRWLIANHHSGGTMTYAHMGHIHVDIGYHFVKLNSGGRKYASRRSTRGKHAVRAEANKKVAYVPIARLQ